MSATKEAWVDCPECDAVIGVPPRTKRVVGPCPKCGARLAIDRSPLATVLDAEMPGWTNPLDEFRDR
jgi:uncharacterized paraquat-inducible protein A